MSSGRIVEASRSGKSRTSSSTRPSAVIPFLFAATACGGVETETSSGWSEVRDSAGITIVRNRVPAGDPLRWAVAGSPAVSIGSVDGPEGGNLFNVVGAARLHDGRILIANAGTSEIKVFDQEGAFIEAWGRAGEGPGEFSNLGGMAAWMGDSVAAWEWTGERLTIFDSQGHPGRSIATRLGDSLPAPPLSVSTDGQLLVATLLRFSPANIEFGLISRPRPYALLGPSGETLANLGEYSSGELYVPENLLITPHPYGRGALATIWGSEVVIGLTHTFEVRVFDGQGHLSRIIRREHEPVGVDRSHMDDWMAGRLANADEAERRRLQAVSEEFPLVESFPAYSSLMDDPLGYLWIQDYALPSADRVVWSVFDRSGQIIGSVETPEAREVLEIGPDYLLTLHADDLNVEYVQMWHLDRQP